MSGDVQRVVVIQDATLEINPIAIRWVLHGSSLNPGDAIIFFGALQQVNNPSTLSFTESENLLGYRFKVESRSMFGVNPKFIAEVSKRKEEYINNVEVIEIAKQCEKEQIEFHVEVRAGPNPKELALKAAKNFRATWMVLDKQMKRDKKYFMDNLPCGISRMKRNNSIEQLRGPKSTNVTSETKVKSKGEDKIKVDEKDKGKGVDKDEQEEGNVPYDEMLPGSPKRKRSGRAPPDSYYHVSSLISASSSTSTTGYHEQCTSSSTFKTAKQAYMNFQVEEKNSTSTEQDTSVCKNRRPKIGWKRDFSYAEIHAATEGFSQTKFLSEGGFGCVYRGDLDGLAFAVKQHNGASFQGEKEFESEVEVLSKVRHENLVMLLGSCSKGSDRLLVYEYVCYGSLDQHLSKHARKPLTWEKRMKIALGAARGLKYVHENNIILRDMRPKNILMTHDHEALLGDFGLARTQYEDSEQSWETRVVGALGYLAPENAESGKVSTKTDARPLLKERNYPDLIDERILESHDVHQLFWMVRVAEKCLSKDPQKRLTMTKVVYALNYIIESNSTCSFGELIPAKSDSPGSAGYSYESQDYYDTSSTAETLSTSLTADSMSTSSMGDMSLKTSTITPSKLSPSPPILAVSSRRSSTAVDHLKVEVPHFIERWLARYFVQWSQLLVIIHAC
uniref:Protein kinase domain-containing protein n=1 Tax=Populus alba TaxID=43335 RepID=A0A4U5QF91_POPAL|nr:hypothetical protein D5086_0000095980 [Populus alba]